MDFLFILIFDFLLSVLWISEHPKIEVRLLSSFPNEKDELHFEIENISNSFIKLTSVSMFLKSNGTHKFFHQNLEFAEQQLTLPCFAPREIMLTVPVEKKIERIKYFQFELIGKKVNRIKVTPKSYSVI